MERLDGWLYNRPAETGVTGRIKGRLGKTAAPTIVCSKCENRVPLWDDMEQHFASPETKQRVRELQE
jgi:hypothetical protein